VNIIALLNLGFFLIVATPLVIDLSLVPFHLLTTESIFTILGFDDQ